MVNHYIARELLRKNRGVYFKKGKWILHVLFLVVTFLGLSLADTGTKRVSIHGAGPNVPALLSLVMFVLFFYTYCLYLIPVCFKRGRHLRFWILLALMLFFFPLITIGLQHWVMPHYPAFNKLNKMSPLLFCREIYGSFIGYFFGFTSLLYLMELLEEIRTSKEIQQNSAQLLATEQRLIKTRMDPDFVTRSLDGITALAERKDAEAPDSVIRFSDVLRYRLYRSAAPRVPLEEELMQLGNLVRFHNSIHEAEGFCKLEIEGRPDKKALPPLSLINIVEPLLNLYSVDTGWSLILYVLIEEEMLQMAIELSADPLMVQPVVATIQSNLHSIFENTLTFNLETEGSTNSMRICLPIQNN